MALTFKAVEWEVLDEAQGLDNGDIYTYEDDDGVTKFVSYDKEAGEDFEFDTFEAAQAYFTDKYGGG